ncbi:MAG TPA: hypothetical protein PLU30_15880 [Verrucomicrobiae bacterium]|nr:hypothetical protein [Verrucomicrobiae bacterium]
MKNCPRLTRLAAAAATIAILAACGAPFNPQSFAKIQNGMTEAEVTAILGKPTSIESGSLPILNITGTEYTYRSGNARGTIAFVNGKVVLKEATFGDMK